MPYSYRPDPEAQRRAVIPRRPVPRGCGLRIAGAIYWEFGVVREMPANNTPGADRQRILLDPPVPIDIEALGMTAVGMHPIERDGVTHILDWVGEDHYPNVADFIEEARRWGVSRRMPRNLPWRNLSARSTLLLVHRRGFIRNWRDYRPQLAGADRLLRTYACPTGNPDHATAHGTLTDCCAGVWWDDITGGVVPQGRAAGDRTTVREMPWGTYTGRERPEGVEPQYETAIVARVPLGAVAVIQDTQGNTHQQTMQRLQERLREAGIRPQLAEF